MSVSDPLLKEFKAHIFEMHKTPESEDVTDRNPAVMPFFQVLESILRKGINSPSTAFGKIKKDYWNWIESVPEHRKYRQNQIESMVVICINEIRSCIKVHTSQGKGRLFLRHAVANQFLHSTLQFLAGDKEWLKNTYNPETSIIGHPVLSEIFFAQLLECRNIKFSFKLFNSSFLDKTWLLPIYKRYEFVPCDDLGIKISLYNHRSVIVSVEKGSVAEEEDQIEIGDVIDEVYGIFFFDKRQRHLNKIMKQYSGLPVYACIIKCHFQSGTIYPPIVTLINGLSIDSSKLINKFLEKEKNMCETNSLMQQDNVDTVLSDILGAQDLHQNLKSEQSSFIKGENVVFLGAVEVGNKGRVTEIEIGLNKILSSKPLNKPMKMLLKETEVKLVNPENGDVEFRHSFTEISSCGRRKDIPLYLAYIAGETTCSISKNFTCYIFQTESSGKTKLLLNCIVQGFNRTHWAV